MTGAGTKFVDRKVFYAGQDIFKKGEVGERAFLIQEGAVEIIIPLAEGREKLLAVVGTGAIFGEMALVDDQPRMATARAKEQTTVMVIGRAQFQQKLEKADPFIRALLNIFVRNIRDIANRST